jgi:hypothetical protein
MQGGKQFDPEIAYEENPGKADIQDAAGDQSVKKETEHAQHFFVQEEQSSMAVRRSGENHRMDIASQQSGHHGFTETIYIETGAIRTTCCSQKKKKVFVLGTDLVGGSSIFTRKDGWEGMSKRPPKMEGRKKKKKNQKQARQVTKESSGTRFVLRIPKITLDFGEIANKVKIAREYFEALHLASESLSNQNSDERGK